MQLGHWASVATRREEKRQIGRDAVLDAAERLLRGGATADFSMRDLAVEAGVSFATPFNQFGSKSAIMQALSARLIDAMAARFRASTQADGTVDRVLAMVRVACDVLLKAPAVNRPIIGSLGAPSPTPGQVSAHSSALWALALGGAADMADGRSLLARTVMPDQLALCFRGCLSFWGAGEIGDDALPARARRRRNGAARLRRCRRPATPAGYPSDLGEDR